MNLWTTIKGLLVQDETDRTKEFSVEVHPSSTTGTRTTLVANQTSNRVITLPDVTGVLITSATTNTLTNKTIDADLNTITNIENADIKAGAAIDASKIADGSVSSAEFQFINSLTSNAQTQLNSNASAISTHISNPTAAHAGSAISNIPLGNLSSIDVQSALNELQTEIDAISAGGEVNTASNVGTGTGLSFKQKVGVDLQFRSILAGTNIVITNNSNEILIDGTVANMAASTIKGRAVGAGTGAPTDLTGTQATAILDVFSSTLKGLVPASGGGTVNFLRADGSFAAPGSQTLNTQEFLSSGTFNVPAGVTEVEVLVVGGGAGGAGAGNLKTSESGDGGSGGGGGAGSTPHNFRLKVVASSALTVTIGAGGSGGAGGIVSGSSQPGSNGNNGGNTTITGTGVDVKVLGGFHGSGGGGSGSPSVGAGGTAYNAANFVGFPAGSAGDGGQGSGSDGTNGFINFYVGTASLGGTANNISTHKAGGGGSGGPGLTIGGAGGNASTDATGSAGTAAAANSGAGGGGGGGAGGNTSTSRAGGAGAAGGSGYVKFFWLA